MHWDPTQRPLTQTLQAPRTTTVTTEFTLDVILRAVFGVEDTRSQSSLRDALVRMLSFGEHPGLLLLVGPEGGFDPEERAAIRAHFGDLADLYRRGPRRLLRPAPGPQQQRQAGSLLPVGDGHA